MIYSTGMCPSTSTYSTLLLERTPLTQHRCSSLFYWIFVPLVQRELDESKLYWNNHKIRRQKNKQMPSGHIPIDVFENPEAYHLEDCRIPVPPNMLTDLREDLTEQVGPRSQYFSWYSDHFDDLAQQTFDALHIGRQGIELENAWTVFKRMADVLTHVQHLL